MTDPMLVAVILFAVWVAGTHLVFVGAGYVLSLLVTIPSSTRPLRGRCVSAVVGTWFGAIAGFTAGLGCLLVCRAVADRVGLSWGWLEEYQVVLVLAAYFVGVGAGWLIGWRAGALSLRRSSPSMA